MEYFARLAAFSPLLFLLVLMGLMIVAREIGLWLGRLHVSDGTQEGVGIVVGAMLALLAFVLALTLSSSSGRFQERRQSTLVEANAIASVWALAQATEGAPAAQLAALMPDYTHIRASFVAAPADRALLAGLDGCSAEMQGQMRDLAAQVMRDQPEPVTEPLLGEVNAMVGATTAVRFAFNAQMPRQVFWLLMGMAALSVAGLGYQLGMRGQSLRILSALIIFMWALVVMDILDLGTARIGSIGTDASVYQWVLDDLGGSEAGAPRPLPAACAPRAGPAS